MRRGLAMGVAVAVLGLPASALAGHGLRSVAAHGLDHPAPSFGAPPAPSSDINSGGEGAEWELLDTVTTGNPHTDIDFFTQNGETYLSAGTLGNATNGGGQTIVQLTDSGAIAPELVSSQPSASCITDPSQSLGLQHDVEATPKGDGPLNARNPFADTRDAQLLIDATDNPGRCHDDGSLGVAGVPQGGLEIIDITDVANPVEIGLTSHSGESHTVNIDPKRPHIAYSVTSDSVGIDSEGKRDNRSGTAMDLDGFEVVDLRSCMNFPAGTSVPEKRAACRPKVYRYRYPTKKMSLGHTDKDGGSATFGCHELEVYPSDLLTCGSGNALIALNMKHAFDRNGTPSDFSDDKPRGEPLPCRRRASTSMAPFATGAKVIDCVDGKGNGEKDLSVGKWLRPNRPSLRGVRWIGSVFHQGGGPQNTDTPYPATKDVAFNHESELTASGRFLLATDERGGGVVPPGATCAPAADNPEGNGGVHAYRFTKVKRKRPKSAKQAWRAYARTKKGKKRKKAIFRTPIHTGPQGSLCTAHVFQQIPGQNRIFMGWYTQGTQVLDFKEKRNGRIKFTNAGYLIPDNANTWTSHVFDWERNPDGTFTYRGATGDFNLGAAGRSSIDIYEATLPAPPRPKGPTRDLCRKRWQFVHKGSGRPFASRAACIAYARR